MKSKTTAIWFVLAVAFAAAIWILDNYFAPGVVGEQPVLAGLRPIRVTAIQVIPAGARELSVIRTNKTWLLQQPVAYPAQTAAIDGLLDALQKLTPVISFSAGDMNSRKNADAEFGFDNPQFTLDVTAGDQSWHLRVGNKTAPGDGVYVRVVGAAGAYVTDTAWLQFLPHDVTDWRDTALVDLPPLVDWLVITNGMQAIELRRNETNRLWYMVRPLQTRADNLLIVTALQQLQTAKVSRFVNDDPKADLTAYGLAPSALDVWLGAGTNLLAAVHAGKEVAGAPGEVYVRREDWNAVVTTARDVLAPWRAAVNDFRDHNLLELTAPVAEIEVQGGAQNDNNFTLQFHGSNGWSEAGEKFLVDSNLVTSFIRTLTNLRVADFVQDAVTASGLQTFGLASPSARITLRSVAGDTNSVIAGLLFGGTNNGEIYVKGAGEDFVYGLPQLDYARLLLPGGYFRTPPVWNFSETNVAQVTLRQNGLTRRLIRTGAADWSLAPGSQGIINPPGIEETVHRLGDLSALAWVGRKVSDADIGLTSNSLSLTVELKSGEQYALDFGQEEWLPSLNASTPLAAAVLDGERWAFLFPPVLYPLVRENLTIPADVPK